MFFSCNFHHCKISHFILSDIKKVLNLNFALGTVYTVRFGARHDRNIKSESKKNVAHEVWLLEELRWLDGISRVTVRSDRL